MTTDNFCFYLQNRLIQASQTGGQWYSDTSPFSIPCFDPMQGAPFRVQYFQGVRLWSPFQYLNGGLSIIVHPLFPR